MKFILNKDILTVENKESFNSGSLKYYEIPVEKDSTWDGLGISAIIIKEGSDKGNAIALINNKIYVDREYNGKYFVGFKGFIVEYNLTEDVAIDTSKSYYTRSGDEGSYVYTKVENPVVGSIGTYYEETKTFQQSTNLVAIHFVRGAGEIEVRNTEIPTQSEWEAYVSQIQDMTDGLDTRIDNLKYSDLYNDNYTVQDENYVHTDNNYTTTEKTKLAGLNNYDDTEVRGLIAGKVDKETGKGLSTNDFTTAEKTKLANLENYNDAEIKQDIVDLGINKADKSEIPDVSGFYTKPNTGIPKTDLSSSVQTSLGKADTAIQDISGKQDLLVSGTNIKTINNESILGSGNLTIQGGGSDIDVQINGTSIVSSDVANIVTKTAYNSSTNKIATESDLPDISGKQDTLVSGTNIKTINNSSVLGNGDLAVNDSNARSAILSLISDLTETMSYNAPAVAKGTSLTLNDTAELGLSDLRIHGKTVQNGTPSPSNPVAIENVYSKNLLKPYTNTGSTSSSGITVTMLSDGSLKINGTCSSSMWIEFIYAFQFNTDEKTSTKQILFDDRKYTLSLTKKEGSLSGNNDTVRLTIQTKSDNTQAYTDLESYITFIGAKGIYRGFIRIWAGTYTNLVVAPMLEEGDTKTEWVPYNSVQIKRTDGTSEETYSFPLGDTPLMQGDWIDSYGVHHVKGQKIFNGSEDWTLLNSSSSRTTLYITVNDIEGYSSSSDIPRLISSYFVPASQSATWQSGMVSRNSGSGTQKNVYFIIGGNETVSSFKTWLSSNPVTLEYYLATPTLTAFTDEQRQVYDTILQDGTYEVVTNYTTEGNLAPEIEVTYQKDLASKFEAIQDEIEEILGE